MRLEELKSELMYQREQLKRIQEELLNSELRGNGEKFEYLLEEREKVEERISELMLEISQKE